MLTQENADLKSQVKKLSGIEDDLSGVWEIAYRNNVLTVKLEALADNRYRLGPPSLGFSGVYRLDGTTLTMVAENPGYPDLVWSMKKPGLFEMVAGNYVGALMRRKVAGSTDAGPSKP